MAEIIGYDKKVIKRYKGICPQCGAIIIFEENELHDDFQYNEYCYSKGTCPGCGYQGVSLNKNKDKYESVTEFYGWPDSTNCSRNCTKCQMRCLFRKEQYSEMKNKELNIIDCAPLNLKAQGVYFQENSNADYCTSETFKRGDAVCFKSHPSIRIGTISEDFGDSVHVFTSDAYFKEFAPYGGPNTLTVRKDSIQLFDNQSAEEPLPVFIQESNVQQLKYQ